ncbi:hypothetical protein FANTH_8795 [Fusarium anthophilum]|uniref:Uncharacterized protein n=1 Tax=Fusarium anthophilum TaxID=48485 RepID=A0A8H5E013_9HYPO|nr:hypothetical protein FANTH_8795 [Fusarium anthophilum]
MPQPFEPKAGRETKFALQTCVGRRKKQEQDPQDGHGSSIADDEASGDEEEPGCATMGSLRVKIIETEEEMVVSVGGIVKDLNGPDWLQGLTTHRAASLWSKLTSRPMRKVVLPKAEAKGAIPSLYNRIELQRQLETLNPRDLIYGLLGVSQASVVVDYSKPLHQVYHDYASGWIRWAYAQNSSTTPLSSMMVSLVWAGIGVCILRQWQVEGPLRSWEEVIVNITSAEQFWNLYKAGETDGWEEFLIVSRRNTKDTCLSQTATGYFGLGPLMTESSDLTCVFPGVRLPMIFRPKGNLFELMGTCYVHGLMDGEAVGDDVQAWETTLSDFVLM